MPKQPVYSSKELVKIVEQNGFFMKRQTGSHMIFGNGKGLRIVIPNHNKKSLHPKIVKDTLEVIKNMNELNSY